MLRPLFVGLPVILSVCAAFVVAMNVLPFDSPYFMYAIIGYVVLFPLALLITIIMTIRSVKRVVAGGDIRLRETGARTMATVIRADRSGMTLRLGGGPRMSITKVRLKLDNLAPDISTTKAASFFAAGSPHVGDRVPVYLDRHKPKNFFIDWQEASGAGRVSAGTTAIGSVFGADLGNLVSQLQQASQQAGYQVTTNTVSTGGGAPQQQTYEPPPQQSQPRYEPPVETYDAGGGGLEGRARIEGLKPYPDGTYDLDLYVTPRGKSSYRVAARVPVPAGTGLLEKGQMLKVRIDPDIASRIEVVWE